MSLQRSFRKARIADEIVNASNGEDALDILRGTNGRNMLAPPYVLLDDINMPRMNGIELLREIRADHGLRHIVAFVLTTSDHEADILTAYDQNVAGYLLNRDAGTQFLRAVSMLEDFWNLVELPVQ